MHVRGAIRTHSSATWFFLVVLGPANSALGQETALEWGVDQVFAAVDDPDSAGCAVSVMRDGAVIYKNGYGMANLEYGIPITPSSVFHVASVSKQFTAFAVALLAAEGLVSWDDDIRVYVPEVPSAWPTITLEDLVHHISGIRDQWDLLSMAGWRWEADVVKQEDVLDIISRQRALNFQPGDEYLYSNTGFTLLAVVVERVSGQSLREYTSERIFAPLGMHDTHFHDDHEMIVKDRAYAYKPDSAQGLKISIPDFDVVGASSLFTTVEDLARWDRNFYTAGVGGEQVLELMHRRGVLNDGDQIDYAFGLSHGEYRGLGTVSHGGADAGYRAYFVRFPEQSLSLAVLCNYRHSTPWAKAFAIADLYLEEDFTEPAESEDGAKDAVEVPTARLAELDGYYLAPQTDFPVLVRFRDGELYEGRFEPQRLIPLGDDRFRISGSEIVYSFSEDDETEIAFSRRRGATVWEYKRAAPADTTPGVLRDYIGMYGSEELGAGYSVRMQDGGLNLLNRKHGSIPLEQTHRDGFSTDYWSLNFTRASDGKLDGFTLSSPRVRRVKFIKLGSSPP